MVNYATKPSPLESRDTELKLRGWEPIVKTWSGQDKPPMWTAVHVHRGFITWILEKISRLTNGVEKAPNRLLKIENETTSQDLSENRTPEA